MVSKMVSKLVDTDSFIRMEFQRCGSYTMKENDAYIAM